MKDINIILTRTYEFITSYNTDEYLQKLKSAYVVKKPEVNIFSAYIKYTKITDIILKRVLIGSSFTLAFVFFLLLVFGSKGAGILFAIFFLAGLFFVYEKINLPQDLEVPEKIPVSLVLLQNEKNAILSALHLELMHIQDTELHTRIYNIIKEVEKIEFNKPTNISDLDYNLARIEAFNSINK